MIDRTQTSRTRWRFLALASIVAVLPLAASGEPCPENAARSVRVDVHLDQDAATITVDPESVEVVKDPGPGRPNRVCWIVDGLVEGQTLIIEGKPDSGELFPSLEREIRFPRTFANSGTPAKVGVWTYDVAVTDAEGGEVMRIDPEVTVVQGP